MKIKQQKQSQYKIHKSEVVCSDLYIKYYKNIANIQKCGVAFILYYEVGKHTGLPRSALVYQKLPKI